MIRLQDLPYHNTAPCWNEVASALSKASAQMEADWFAGRWYEEGASVYETMLKMAVDDIQRMRPDALKHAPVNRFVSDTPAYETITMPTTFDPAAESYKPTPAVVDEEPPLISPFEEEPQPVEAASETVAAPEETVAAPEPTTGGEAVDKPVDNKPEAASRRGRSRATTASE